MNVAAHPLTTKTPQMLPQHHYVVSFKSWTKTTNRASRCDRLHHTVSSCSKIPGAPTISQVISFHNKSHYTFSSKPTKNLTKMMIAITTVLEIARFLHISLDLVPKMQILDLLLPSWRSWCNGKSGVGFKRIRSPKRFPSPIDYYQNPNKLHTF
jgi:hypothetical protein